MIKIKITIGEKVFHAQLNNSDTAKAILGMLPFKGKVSVWGNEIYFVPPVQCALEKDARAELEVGELGYWPNMPAFCLFFGPTPLSNSEKPVAAGPVNVFGTLTPIDLDGLKSINDNENITVEVA